MRSGEGECPKSQFIFLVRLPGCIPQVAKWTESRLKETTGSGLKSAIRTCVENMNYWKLENDEDVADMLNAIGFANVAAQYVEGL